MRTQPKFRQPPIALDEPGEQRRAVNITPSEPALEGGAPVLRDVLAAFMVVAGVTLLVMAAFMVDTVLGIASLGAALLTLGLILGLGE